MSWSHVSDSTPMARKAYNCRGCWELIEIGEVHVARRGFDDEGPITVRLHRECLEFMDDADSSDQVWEYPPGSFSRSEAKEHQTWQAQRTKSVKNPL